MIIKINKSDLLKGQPLTPGWYKVVLMNPKTEVNGDRIDGTITAKFEDPTLARDDRQEDFNFYNMVGKGIGFLVPLMAAVQGKTIKEISDALESGAAVDFDFDAIAGKKVQVKIANDVTNTGRMRNVVGGWLPYDVEPSV